MLLAVDRWQCIGYLLPVQDSGRNCVNRRRFINYCCKLINGKHEQFHTDIQINFLSVPFKYNASFGHKQHTPILNYCHS